ncbi:MAG: Gfo/Idh/MocA family oxidoreductase [Pirellulales bacterium]|nr:Gfo/Idh/MocA family oxidoreductase [Pirellulales bacterium]
MTTPDRRTVLKSLATTASLAAIPRIARSAAPLRDDPRLALVGCGVRARAFTGRVAYVCDPDAARLAAAAKANNVPTERAVADMRRLLDDPAVDGVIVAAPDHWHAPAAILAANAGKHVYLEKPCCHNLREGELLLETARRTGVVIQHGTQQRSRPFTRDAIQQLHEGVIGEVLVARAWNVQRRDDIGRKSPATPPPGVDYDLWVGPAEFMPFQENRFHTHWHWWHNFGTGDVGNDGAHELDYAQWGLGVAGPPTRVAALGGKYRFNDDQQFPDTATCTFEYAGAQTTGQPKQLVFEMRLWSKNYPLNCDSGVEFYGTQGQMFLSKRGKLRITDDDNRLVQEIRPEGEAGFPHLDNFIEAIRNGKSLNAPIPVGVASVAPVHYANIALRVGRTLAIDPSSGAILEDAEANALARRQYRAEGHWAIPEGAAT